MERRAYVSKVIKGNRYWYFQKIGPLGGRKQYYIGPEFPFLRSAIEQYNEAKREIMAQVA